MSGLLAVEDAQARLLDGVAALPGERVPLTSAHRRILAADVVAIRSQPPAAVSAMDGYAIRWADHTGPWRRVGESAAGRGFVGVVGVGEAVRIFTGARVPQGADTVIVQEDVAAEADRVTLTGEGPPRLGAHIRREGLDFAVGEVVGRSGERLTPARLGLFASAGDGMVVVHRRPRVVLLATGDELVPPGTPPAADQIVSSNGVMLAALLEAAGAEVVDGGIVRDDRAALAATFRARSDADILVTIGGASVGDHDLVRPVLREIGAEIDFWRIALRPGKPMLAGTLGHARVVGLPGNPVSAFVCATLFIVPLIRRMIGLTEPLPPTIGATLAVPLGANGPRRDYLRARRDDGIVVPAETQDSSMLRTLADSNVLIVRGPFAAALAAGDHVECLALDTDQGVA